MTKAKLEFDLSDEDSKSEFNCAIKGKTYAFILFNLKNIFTKISNDKNHYIENYNNELQNKLNNLNLSEQDISHINNIFHEAKDHICKEFFEEFNEINLDEEIY